MLQLKLHLTFALFAISARGEMGGESSKFYLLLSELITGKQMIRGEQKTALLRRGYDKKLYRQQWNQLACASVSSVWDKKLEESIKESKFLNYIL